MEEIEGRLGVIEAWIGGKEERREVRGRKGREGLSETCCICQGAGWIAIWGREGGICRGCAQGFGHFRWDAELLRRAAGYIEGGWEVIKGMRAGGATFTEVGAVIGVSRQRAHQLWKRRLEREGKRVEEVVGSGGE